MKKIVIAAFLLIAAVMLSSSFEAEAAKNKIKLNTKAVSLEKGTAFRLKVENADGDIVFSSSNTKIAKVSSTGRIKAKKAGSCKIYAQVGSTTLKCRVTVYNSFSAGTSFYTVKGLPRQMGELPVKKYRYDDDSESFRELSAMKNDFSAFFGLREEHADIKLDDGNYVFILRRIKHYAAKYPGNALLDAAVKGLEPALEGAESTDVNGNICHVIVKPEDDAAYFFVYYKRGNKNDYDCIFIGCDKECLDRISWKKN